MQAGFADGFAAAGHGEHEQEQKSNAHTPQINADQRRFNAGVMDCGFVLAMAKACSTSSQNWPQSWSWERLERRSCWASWPISCSCARSVVKKVMIDFSAESVSPWEMWRPNWWRSRRSEM